MSQHQHGRSQNNPPPLSDAELEQIITEDTPTAAQLMVIKAEAWGRYLKDQGLKTSQIRAIFGHVRQLEMNWPREGGDPAYVRSAVRDLILLKPKMAYQGQRVKEVKPLADLLAQCVDQVDERRDHFQRFVEFFEAILAYHRAAGGSES